VEPAIPFQRYPHVQYFGSAAALTLRLSQLMQPGCTALKALSLEMRQWNNVLVADDAEFWHSAIATLIAPIADRVKPVEFVNRNRPSPIMPHVPGPIVDMYMPMRLHCLDDKYPLASERCGQGVQQMLEWSPRSAAQEPTLKSNVSDEERCLWGPAETCDERLLRYGTHFLQKMYPSGSKPQEETKDEE